MAVGRNTRFREFMTVQDMIPMPVREDERDNLATVLLRDLHRPLVCFGRRVDDHAFLELRLNKSKSIGAYRWKFLRFDNHINHNDAGAGLGFNAELMIRKLLGPLRDSIGVSAWSRAYASIGNYPRNRNKNCN